MNAGRAGDAAVLLERSCKPNIAATQGSTRDGVGASQAGDPPSPPYLRRGMRSTPTEMKRLTFRSRRRFWRSNRSKHKRIQDAPDVAEMVAVGGAD